MYVCCMLCVWQAWVSMFHSSKWNVFYARVNMHSYWLLVCIVLRYCSRYAYWNSPPRLMRYLPRSRSVPTSLYDLSMMYSTNRGTPQYSPFNQINTVTHMLLGNTKHVLFEALLTTGETHSGHLAWNDQRLEVLNRWRRNS